ncbi:MAG: response regulator [Anaerolineae bacterium]|nr:response regulator [Anaerolineae bacterium]
MTRPEQTGVEVRNRRELAETLNLDEVHDTFIRNVSHELRTPIALLLGYADLLYAGELGALSPEQQRAVGIIVNRTQELKKTVTRIGTLLAVQAHRSVQQLLTPMSLVTQVVEAQRACAEVSGIALELHLSAELPRIIGDGEQLQLVFECLIENAIKFTPRGGCVSVHLWADRDWVNLSVSDTGIGIARADMARLFAPFEQLDAALSRAHGGMGLGLTLARSIVVAHRGEITVDSQPGQGSCFTVKLPPYPAIKNPLIKAKSGAPRRILIVDDEECVAFTLREGLQKLPRCEIVVTSSGQQALELFKKQPFDLLITDYKMPDLDGVALASCIQKNYPGTGIIMITAYGYDLIHDPVAARAIQRVLQKPIRLSEIRDVALETLALYEKG